MFQLGQRVKVKENAYGDFAVPSALAVRGETGVIAQAYYMADSRTIFKVNCYVVDIDDEWWPLLEDEIELVED